MNVYVHNGVASLDGLKIRNVAAPVPVEEQCGDMRRGSVIDWRCNRRKGHTGRHSTSTDSRVYRVWPCPEADQ